MNPIIEVHHLGTLLEGKWVHQALNFTVHQGETVAIVGESGCGKTTLLRSILLLQPIQTGQIRIFNQPMSLKHPKAIAQVRRRWGVLFQQNALFSSLTVLENIMFVLDKFTHLTPSLSREIALMKMVMVGLSVDACHRYPSELSGGMQKRAALARALALDPELLLLDEPTAGLDPQSASDFDQLTLDLKHSLNLTIVMISHDPDSLWQITDKVAFIGDKRILAMQSMEELSRNTHPQIQHYFTGQRMQKRQPPPKEH